MLYRVSQKLAKRLKVGSLDERPLASNEYIDWTARFFIRDRRPFVLLCNTKSLYSMVVSIKGITTVEAFRQAMVEEIRRAFEADGFAKEFEFHVQPETDSAEFAKALNRSVTSSMNQLMYLVEDTDGDDVDWFALRAAFNDYLLSSLAQPGEHYGTPEIAFRRLQNPLA